MLVNAVRDLGSVGKGGSQSRFFLCDDDKEYVVKFAEPTTKTAINELVAGTLALKINLPTPNIVQVNISQNMIDLSDELKKRNFQAGLHVGIERLPKESAWDFDYLTNEMLLGKTLVNQDALYGVICFDNWVLNADRNNKGNNMIEFLSENQMRFVIIDFGHCFTSNSWGINLKESQNSDSLMGIFDFIITRLTSFNEFEQWFNRIEKINDGNVDIIIDLIPSSWNLSNSEKSILQDLIKSRKNLIREVITKNKKRLNIGA